MFQAFTGAPPAGSVDVGLPLGDVFRCRHHRVAVGISSGARECGAQAVLTPSPHDKPLPSGSRD